MRPQIVVREYARIHTTPIDRMSLDEACVPESAFNWLCSESARLQKSGAALVQVENRRSLKLGNYVGVIETPCGTKIEILPKTSKDAESATASRHILRKMLARCLDVPTRESSPTDIQTFDAPLTEWVMRQFLEALDALVKRGVRFSYRTVRDKQSFLRGKLDVQRQLRQPLGRNHLFQIEHDVFDADSPENRLLRSALDRVFLITRNANNWRLAHELGTLLAEIPRSSNLAADFRRWRSDRLLAHYRPIRPWCALILGEQTPLSLLGKWRGHSLLFPMERVFERYVETYLRKALPQDTKLTAQASNQYLCSHNGQKWFQLRPDFVIEQGKQTWVLDTKWKLLDESLASTHEKYGLNQSDFYQLFAYGQRYLPNGGHMLLIYPMTPRFRQPLPVFTYSQQLNLRVVPFDLQNDRLVDHMLFARDAN